MATGWSKTAKIAKLSGGSAIRAAAYRHGISLNDKDQQHDFSRKQGVIYSALIYPNDTPEWAQSRQSLWLAVEEREYKINAQLARDWLFPLPKELTKEQNIEMILEHVRERFVSRGMIADVAVHEPGWKSDQRNLHAHVMTTTRPIVNGEWGSKTDGTEAALWQGPKFVREERIAWVDRQNTWFEKLGIETRVGVHGSNEESIEAEQHFEEERKEWLKPASEVMESVKQYENDILAAQKAKHDRLKEINDSLKQDLIGTLASSHIGSIDAWQNDPLGQFMRAMGSEELAHAVRQKLVKINQYRRAPRRMNAEERSEVKSIKKDTRNNIKDLARIQRIKSQFEKVDKDKKLDIESETMTPAALARVEKLMKDK